MGAVDEESGSSKKTQLSRGVVGGVLRVRRQTTSRISLLPVQTRSTARVPGEPAGSSPLTKSSETQSQENARRDAADCGARRAGLQHELRCGGPASAGMEPHHLLPSRRHHLLRLFRWRRGLNELV